MSVTAFKIAGRRAVLTPARSVRHRLPSRRVFRTSPFSRTQAEPGAVQPLRVSAIRSTLQATLLETSYRSQNPCGETTAGKVAATKHRFRPVCHDFGCVKCEPRVFASAVRFEWSPRKFSGLSAISHVPRTIIGRQAYCRYRCLDRSRGRWQPTACIVTKGFAH